jgi:hypothetical protein
MTLFVGLAGWAGAIVILASYLLLSARRLSGNSATYHVMNLLGAAGIAANSGWNGALPSAVLNVIWAGIAIYALIAHRGASMGAR